MQLKRKALFKFTPFSHKQKVVLEWWMLESPYADKDGIIKAYAHVPWVSG